MLAKESDRIADADRPLDPNSRFKRHAKRPVPVCPTVHLDLTFLGLHQTVLNGISFRPAAISPTPMSSNAFKRIHLGWSVTIFSCKGSSDSDGLRLNGMETRFNLHLYLGIIVLKVCRPKMNLSLLYIGGFGTQKLP